MLVFLGGVSDRIGRRSTLFASIILLMVAFATLAFAPSFGLLLLGRLLHGFGSGLATSAAASAIMESHPGGLSAGAFLNTLCISTGIAVGPLLTGALTGVSAHPLVTPYLVIAGSLSISFVLLLIAPADRHRVVRTRLVRPIAIPRALILPFSVAAATIASANLAMSLFGSFGAEITAGLGWSSHAGTGWFVSAVFFLLALAQLAGRRWSHATVIVAGVAGVTLGWLVATGGALLPSPGLSIAGSLIVGFSSGLCLLGSAGLIARISPEHRRAEIYSAYLVVAFSSLGLVALGAGPLISRFGTGLVLFLALALSSLLTTWVIIQVRRLRSKW